MMRNPLTATEQTLHSLWINWTISAIAVILTLALPVFIPKSVFPFVVAAIAYGLIKAAAHLAQDAPRQCALFVRVTARFLLLAAGVMLVINLINWLPVFHYYINMSNTSRVNPYITCLVIFPCAAAVCGWTLLQGGNAAVCRRCRARNGYYPGNGIMATLYGRESRYQLSLMLSLSLALAAVQWWYYCVYYMNVNMNKPDRFFFNVMPIILFAFSLYFIWIRYSNMGAIIGPINEEKGAAGTATLRFLVMADDHMLFQQLSNGRWDTPAIATIPATSSVPNDEARNEFALVSGVDAFELKYLYSSKSYDRERNIFHYAAFLDSRSASENTWLRGQWFSIDEVDRMIKTAALSIDLIDEIYRIHTITMAWKTYDRNGKRLYPIRNYVPTFRFRDLRSWDVDYDDISWFNVAENNEDKPLFRFRRLFRRLAGHDK